VNVLDEILNSYSHQMNLKLDQTRYIAKTWDHEFVDSKMVNNFQRSVHSVREKDKQSWIVLLCIFTSKKILLDMWSYNM
jgi:hypothetical protein